MEPLITETLPTAKQPVQTLAIIGAPVIHHPGAFKAVIPKVPWAAEVVLQGGGEL